MIRPRLRVDALYICYWSLMDPLCQTQSLAYLRRLAAQGRRFAIMTFEQPQFQLPPDRAAAVRRELAASGIHWYPLAYHKRPPLLATGFDCLSGILTGLRIARRHGARVVHSRGSIPAAIALGLRTLGRLRFLYDADSRLSEEYADNGHWSRESLAFRVTAFVEAQARRAADAVVVLSDRLRQDFVGEFAVRAPVEVIPCCVDTARFRYDPEARAVTRAELRLADEKLFVYVGKVGPRYLVAESFALFRAARAALGRAHLLVLSGDPPVRFEAVARQQGVEPGAFTVLRAEHADVPRWLSAADAGLALIRPAGCERGSSPIKVAEYLATGLPVVVTDGIGDASELVRGRAVGVVVRGFDDGALRELVDRLRELWAEGDSLRQRCGAAAAECFDLDDVGCARYRRVYERLRARPRRVARRPAL